MIGVKAACRYDTRRTAESVCHGVRVCARVVAVRVGVLVFVAVPVGLAVGSFVGDPDGVWVSGGGVPVATVDAVSVGWFVLVGI